MKGVMAIVGIVLLAAGALILAGTGLAVDEGGGGDTSFAYWSGTVKDKNTGALLGDVTIQLCAYRSGDPAGSPSGTCVTGGTTGNGHYDLTLQPTTAYRVRLTKDGYKTLESTRTTGQASTTPYAYNWELAKQTSSETGGPGPGSATDDDDTPPPPPPPNVGRLTLMGLGIIFLVFGGALVASDAMELLGG